MANSMRIGFTLSNWDGMLNLLKAVPQEVKMRVAASAVGEAAKPFVRAAKAKAPVRTGALRQSITSVIRSYKKSGRVMAIIGPSLDYFQGGKRLKGTSKGGKVDRPANYAHLVEFGHYSRTATGEFGGFAKGFKRRKSSGARLAQDARSFILAQPFLRPAIDAGQSAAEAALVVGFEKGIDKAVKREVAKFKKSKGR